MTHYAFKIGQNVEYRPTTRLASAVPGPYQIIQRGPTEDGEFKYRIKNPRASSVGRCRLCRSIELTRCIRS